LPDEDRERLLERSWTANADAWTDAVRQGRIASRKAGTDAAILDAILNHPRCRVLDLGCGEGWLARAVSPHGYEVTGIDSSDSLVAQADSAGGGRFFKSSYQDLIRDPTEHSGPFGLIVANFSLLGEQIVPLLEALRFRLGPEGRILIQTLHPFVFGPAEPYESGWRLETFEQMGPAFSAHMPYYFRTFGKWIDDLSAAGLAIVRGCEPLDPRTRRPLSLLLQVARKS
jgi:2-polyprenyl-3-methyl-5-hydroxy-6-metoxy-1,4-benzoquinol methylase